MRRIVLIVEDSEQCASTLEIALLSIPGVEIARVSGGAEALEFLRGQQGAEVCALVTDLNMPRMDGFELIEQVRADHPHARIPIVVVSGATDPQAPARVRQLGADAYFSKPYSPAQVRAKLEQLLNAQQSY